MQTRMLFDDMAWERSENIVKAWRRKVVDDDSQYQLAALVAKSRGGTPVSVKLPPSGSFNTVVLINFQDGGKGLIRLAKPAVSMFPEEKTPIEVATMRYIQAHTSIPVPLILDWGTQEQCPGGFGPFIVMEWVENDTGLCNALKDPTMPQDESPVLDPNIPEEKLRTIYNRMAEVLVQLSGPTADRIGALSQVGDDEWVVDKAPLTYGFAELVQLGTLPRSKAPPGPFHSSASYFEFLADLQVEHLVHQRNDAINGSLDCRRKYVARQLFRKLAREDRLAWPTASSSSTFRLWNDDFRPANVLAVTGGKTDFFVSGVIDWEWTYFAPPEFTFSPPWWLLIEKPEYWPAGLDDWTAKYEQKLETFLDELRKVEDHYIARGRLGESGRLSKRMRKCWDDGDFWVFYAMQRSFAFDYIFWHKICPRFFGFGAEEWREGLALLEDEQVKEMDELVQRKMKEMKTRELAWDYDGPEFGEDEKGENPAAEQEQTESTDAVLRAEFQALKQEHEKLRAWVEEIFSKLGFKEDEKFEPES